MTGHHSGVAHFTGKPSWIATRNNVGCVSSRMRSRERNRNSRLRGRHRSDTKHISWNGPNFKTDTTQT